MSESFGEMMIRIDGLRRKEIDRLRSRIDSDAKFAALVELQDLNWDVLINLYQINSVFLDNGETRGIDEFIDSMMDCMCSAFEEVTGREYVPSIVLDRYPDDGSLK